MNESEPNGWGFYVISYSPQLEENESVNVGLLFTGDNQVLLDYDKRFPKLEAIGTKEDELYLNFLFDSVNKNSKNPQMAVERFKDKERQFSLSHRHEILRKPDKKNIAFLKKRFLSKPRFRETTRKTSAVHERLESQLDNFLFSTYQLSPSCLHRKVSLRDVVSKDIVHRLPKRNHVISRCYEAKENLFFIDTISLHASVDSILNRSNKINKTFWLYGKYLKDIRFNTGRNPMRIGVIFNGIQRPDKDLEETYNFIKDLLKGNTDRLIEPHKNNDIRRLGELLDSEPSDCFNLETTNGPKYLVKPAKKITETWSLSDHPLSLPEVITKKDDE